MSDVRSTMIARKRAWAAQALGFTPPPQPPPADPAPSPPPEPPRPRRKMIPAGPRGPWPPPGGDFLRLIRHPYR